MRIKNYKIYEKKKGRIFMTKYTGKGVYGAVAMGKISVFKSRIPL